MNGFVFDLLPEIVLQYFILILQEGLLRGGVVHDVDDDAGGAPLLLLGAVDLILGVGDERAQEGGCRLAHVVAAVERAVVQGENEGDAFFHA